MSKATVNTDEKFPDIQRLRGIMQRRSEENKKVVETKKKEFEEKIEKATQIYYDALLSNIYDALNYMENSNKSGSNMVYISVPTDKIRWGEESDNNFIPWHWIHYGFPVRNSKKWEQRDLKCWNNNKEEMVFRRLQRLCYDNGYYLYDVSDPQKGTKTFLKISIDRRKDMEEIDLWHNFNKFLFDAE